MSALFTLLSRKRIEVRRGVLLMDRLDNLLQGIRSYKWYRFWRWVFGHKYTCCNEITRRCRRCYAEGRIPPEHPAGIYMREGKIL